MFQHPRCAPHAYFQEGQVAAASGADESGGLYQNVYLDLGTYIVSTDIAVMDMGSPFGNYSAGLFELPLNGNVVEVYQFSFVGSWQTLVASLAIEAEASSEIRIRITRPYRSSLTLPQLIDNVADRLVGGGADPGAGASLTPHTTREAIANFIVTVQWLGLTADQERLLTDKLQAALDALEADKDDLAVNALNTFTNQVEARSGKIISESQADSLLSAAAGIIAELQGSP